MTNSTMRARLLASSMITGAALLAASGAYAQAAAPAAATPAAAPGELVVTGSRIPAPNLTSVSPIAVVNSQEIKLEGTTSIETLLNNLPQVSPDMGLTSTNGTAGGANVDLRGLGSKRTLVLVDGKRLEPGDPIVPVPDLDQIPAALVDRVDVVTGGASAVYGSDAISGVVNFIMQKNFQGVRLDAQYGFYQHNNDDSAFDAVLNEGTFGDGIPIPGPHGNVVDGATWNVTGVIGVNSPDDKGNITVYVGYRDVKPILSNARDFSTCEIGTVGNGTFTPGGRSVYNTHLCFGSSNSAFGRFLLVNGTNALGLPPSGDFNNGTTPGTFVPESGADDFNFAPFQYLQREDQRYTAGFFAHYDLNQYVNVYSDFMFSDDESVGQLGPSGLFLGSPTFQINCNNPLASASQLTDLCGTAAGTPTLTSAEIGYRFSDVGGSAAPRDFDFIHDAYKIDVGLKGDLGGGWTYDGYLQYGYTLFNETVTGQYVSTEIQSALLVDPLTGKCTNGKTTCIPLNIFEVGGITQAAAASIAGTQVETGFTQEQIAELDIVGDLGHYGIKSPLATDGVGVALGADYRQDALGLSVDPITAAGGFAGSGGPTSAASGQIDVKELYAELRVPLVQDQTFFKLLQFEGGYRFSQYNQAGDTNTFKVGGEWAPTDDIRFRASFNRAVRAPNVVELFTPQAPGLFSGVDPCARVVAVGSTAYAGCLASGATAAELAAGSIPQCPAGQCGEIIGGNPALKPEVADTYSVGGVLTPHWIPGLSISVDYFNIKVTNVIEVGLGGPAVELSQCIATSAPLYCQFIKRDPVLGSIWANGGSVESINVNVGALQTSGIDTEWNYRLRFNDFHMPDWGSLSFNFVGTWTDHLITTPIAGGGSFDCAGLYGAVCGTPTPKWKSKLRVTWVPASWPITISGQWRYIGGVGVDINSANSFLEGGDAGQFDEAPGEQKIPSFSYFDLSGTWRVKDRYTFRAGINNIFDKTPPVIDTGNLGLSVLPFGNGNTYPNVYDSLGREFFFGVTADF